MRRFVLLSIIIFLFAACKSSYKTDDTKSAEIIMSEAVYVHNDPDGPITINADKIEVWIVQKKRTLSHFNFQQVKPGDIVKMKGHSDFAEVKDASNEIDMKGDVEIIVYDDDGMNTIKADSLKFDSASGEVAGAGGFDLSWGGLTVTGEGLFGNIKKGRFKFDKVNEGYLK